MRTPMILMSPPTPMLEKFQFPQNSIYHFYTYEGTAPGPTANEYLFREIEKPIAVEHILDATSMEGDPRMVPVQSRTIINKFHATNRRYRWMRQGILSLRDVRSLAVMNYALVTNRYRYKRTILSNYSRWFNITKTVWDTMGRLAVESPRHQFYFVDTPSILGSVQTYQRVAEKGVIPPLLKFVNTPEKAFFQQLWNWVDPATRADTVFTSIPVEELKKINLVFRESGRFVMINMGRLYEWIDHGATGDVLDLKKKGIAPIRMQKILLRMMLSLTALRADSSAIVSDDTGEESSVASIQTSALSSSSPTEQDMDEVDNAKEKTKADELTEMMENLDKDLAELDNLEKKREASGFEDTPITELETQEDSEFDEPVLPANTSAATTERVQQPESRRPVMPSDFSYDPTAEEAVSTVADALAEEGLISASEYKRVIKTAANYKSLKAPDGQGTLEEYAKIDPEILVVPDQVPLKIYSQFVTDPSMLRSSLKDMTQTYAKKVLHKDVANMVIDIQRAGNSITEYEKEKVEDVLGAYEMHTVRLKPVVGQASTLRFKLPVIDDDGNYTSGSVKYKARLQRVDNPIRKIGPDTVALSSYYGKTFVKRSSKKVDDWGDWLRNKISADGLGENKIIRNMVPRIVFDPEFECPYLFSQLAMGFESFSAKGFDFALSKETRVAMFTPEEFKQYEVDGSRLIAKNIEGGVIFVNKNDNLCIVPVPGSEIVVARADDFFEFYGGPVLQVDVKIFGKEIPIGIVLGYKYGLERLIKKLNISYRRVMAGERAKATTDEWVMKFSDETLIFKRSDRLATLILSGFNSFEKVIKNYSVFTFDKPGVYLNLLDNMGLSARYLREIDLMDQLFVDSITKGILADMGEPQDFRGLLIRSCQMLLNDNHKNQQDMSEMRLRGYERMAGAVYNEMVQSIRAHNGRPGKAMQKVEMHPFAVWKRIAQDPSVMVVGDINPVENLKDEEGVTYTGEGGRSKRAMVKRNRIYHESDMGVISEATKDSSDVAINIYTSANPRFKNLRGQTRDFDLKRDGVASLVSTSALLAPCSDKDDPKRVNVYL